MKMKVKNMATLFALLAASIYSINIPLSKLLLKHVGTTMMAGFLYFGAGIGLIVLTNIMKFVGISKKQEPLTKKELPYTIAMVILDIIAPILLMFGISMTNSANVSLLNNFEIVATSIIALVIFKEIISKKLWIAIFFVTMASIILSFEGKGAFVFNKGSLLVLAASTCWGFENNCTKMLSNKDPIEMIKNHKKEYSEYLIILNKISELNRECFYNLGYRFRAPLYWCLAQDGDNSRICLENMKYKN